MADLVLDGTTAERHAGGTPARPEPPLASPAPAARRGGTRRGLAVRLLVAVVLLGLAGAGLYGFQRFKEQAIAASFAGNVPPPTPVAAEPAQVGAMPRRLTGIGTATAVRGVMLSAEVQGRVTRIIFEAGAVVKAGDPLVQLNDAPERADLASAEARVLLAEANLGRSRTLATRDFATRATTDANQAELDRARADVERTRAMIDQKLVKAPFDGVLGIRRVELGQIVEPGRTLLSLTDLENLYVDFTLPEQSRAEIEVGQPVEVTVDAHPGRVFTARLATIEPQVDPVTRTISLQATLGNPDQAILPGMFANARVVLPEVPGVVTVPATAVSQTLYGSSVFVLRPGEAGADGKPTYKAEQVFVTAGAALGDRVALSESAGGAVGVKAGDLVAVSGQIKLQPGAPVALADDNPLRTPEQTPVE